MPTYKLSYFNGQARAEVSRFLFAIGGIEYEDIRLPREQWLEYKPKTPFGQMPTLEVDGVLLCQQKAIEGYLAKLVNCAGESDLDYARCHMIADCVEDMSKSLQKTFSLPEEEKPAAKKKWAESTNPEDNGVLKFLPMFEKMLGDNGHFVGNKLTWPDLSLYRVLTNWPKMGVPQAELQNSIDKFPKIKKCIANVPTHPKCAAWIAKRPETTF